MKKIIIIGGGAAGLMAAISASRKDPKQHIILLEHNEKVGKKLFITGKGRCNVTNACSPEEFLSHVVTNPRFMYSSFSRFNNEDMMAFLEKMGLKLKVERGSRVFPASDKSYDVIDVLKKACKNAGVEIIYHAHVSKIHIKEPERCFESVELSDHTRICGDALIVATGGVSYPQTGSDGSGYDLVKDLGHTIKTPSPSLVPFTIRESWCKDLMGLTLKNVSIKVTDGKKKVYEGFGEFLFTHFGVSGPLVLTASTKLGRYEKSLEEGRLLLSLDLKPALTMEQLEQRFLREFDLYRNKNISKVIDTMLPKKMTAILLALAGVDGEKKVRDVTKKERIALMETMKNLPLHITGVRDFKEAIITRGGVNTKEINPKTMESKLISRLFFAGEIIDIDAVTGGYNLQLAWSTGYCAGENAALLDSGLCQKV